MGTVKALVLTSNASHASLRDMVFRTLASRADNPGSISCAFVRLGQLTPSVFVVYVPHTAPDPRPSTLGPLLHHASAFWRFRRLILVSDLHTRERRSNRAANHAIEPMIVTIRHELPLPEHHRLCFLVCLLHHVRRRLASL
jgi:hypothetical protein